jgi:hypothetical protein
MGEEGQGVVLFGSTHHAIKAERVLLGKGFEIMLIPVPRYLSSDCGIAIKFDLAVKHSLTKALEEENVVVTAIHPLTGR